MLLDRAFRSAVRNFSTLFLAVAVVTVTLHLVHAFVFRDVIAVSELHFEISNLRPTVKLQDVSSQDVGRAETFYWILTALELLLVPVFVGAAARILRVDGAGGVPTVPDGLGHARSGLRGLSLRLGRQGWITVLVGAVFAFLIGFLFERAGLLLTELLPDDRLFLGTGLVRGLARAVGAPFFLASVVVAAEGAQERSSPP